MGKNFIKKRWFVIAVFFLLFNTGLHVYHQYSTVKKLELGAVKARLMVASKSLKYILPKSFHIRNYGKTNISDRENKNIIRKLTDFAVDNDFRFVYSFVKRGSNVYFTSSSLGKNESIDNPEVVYGFHFSEASDVVHSAFKKDGYYSEVASDRWGKFYASYYSRRFYGTNERWLAGVEVTDRKFKNAIRKAKLKAIKNGIFIFSGVVPLIVLYWLVVQNRIQKKDEEINKWRNTAERYRMEKYSSLEAYKFAMKMLEDVRTYCPEVDKKLNIEKYNK